MGNRWIVLIDKSPKGPLTEAEIHALLEQGIVRTNDIAYRVEQNSGGKAEWKFLWQFSEFDRRNSAHTTQAKFPILERRTPRPSAEVEEEKKKILLEDIDLIRPEDLTYRPTTKTEMERKFTLEESYSAENDVSSHYTGGPSLASRIWLLALVVPVAASMGYFVLNSGKNAISTPVQRVLPLQAERDEEVVPENLSRSVSSSPLENVKPPPIVRRNPKELPKPVEDGGEISYEEYRKKQEEQLDRERRREEEEMMRADAPAEEEEVSPEPKSKSKRREVTQEEDEAADEVPPPSSDEEDVPGDGK